MKVVVLPGYGEDLPTVLKSLRVEERPVPEPGPGEVLVKMHAAPCNPSDLLFLQDRYGVSKTLPAVPGWEGSGTVVGSGGGLKAWALKGQRVACAGQGDFDGTWAEYYVASADTCLPLVADMGMDQGAMLIVNPLTALALIDEARRLGSGAAVHMAAASQLGRIMVKLAAAEGFPLVNVVRRPAQVDLLEGLGAEHVLNSSEEDFEEQLRELCERLGVRVGFDPIAGEATGQMLRCLPPGSTALVYGALSEQPCGDIDPIALIFKKQSVQGFWLTEWTERQSLVGIFLKSRRLQNLIVAGEIGSEVRARVGFEDFPDALQEYIGEMTAGKVLLTP